MDNHTQYSGFAGVDLAKKVMQIHFVSGDGEITDKQVKRAEFLDFFRNRTKCLIGMEACGASQDWARKLEAMGHEVHLMSPRPSNHLSQVKRTTTTMQSEFIKQCSTESDVSR